MSTRLYLVRHGATELTAEDRFAGATDVKLSDAGRDQLRRLADRLRPAKLRAVYASPLGRTHESARILAAPHRLEVRLEPGLREISHGRWETLTRAEVEKRFPEEYAHWQEDPYCFAPEGGETGLEVVARALPVVQDLVARHQGEEVLVVSHKATIRLLVSVLLGFEPSRYRDRLDQSPACLNIVDFKGPTRARLTLFNDTSHLDGASCAVPEVPAGRLSSWWPPR